MRLRRRRDTRRDERREARREARREVPRGAGDAAVDLRGVRRQYGRGSRAVHALRGIDLTLPRGSLTAVMGPSGSGKSTFLQCAAGLDRPTAGSVRLGGTEITGMSENELTALRRTRLGFVFQSFNLLPSLTVEQNVVLPMRLAGAPRRAGIVADHVVPGPRRPYGRPGRAGARHGGRGRGARVLHGRRGRPRPPSGRSPAPAATRRPAVGSWPRSG